MVRRLIKFWLVFFGVLVFPSLGFAAAKIPYWAGYKSQITTDESSVTSDSDIGLPATLQIEYSKDG